MEIIRIFLLLNKYTFYSSSCVDNVKYVRNIFPIAKEIKKKMDEFIERYKQINIIKCN